MKRQLFQAEGYMFQRYNLEKCLCLKNYKNVQFGKCLCCELVMTHQSFLHNLLDFIAQVVIINYL